MSVFIKPQKIPCNKFSQRIITIITVKAYKERKTEFLIWFTLLLVKLSLNQDVILQRLARCVEFRYLLHFCLHKTLTYKCGFCGISITPYR